MQQCLCLCLCCTYWYCQYLGIALNDGVMVKCKDVIGSGHGSFWGTILAFEWNAWRRQLNICVTIVSVTVKIVTECKLKVLLLESPCLHMLLLCYITGTLLDIETENIIPVDLNSFLYWDAILLAKFYNKLGHLVKSRHYQAVAEQWKTAVTAVHWNENIGTWLDYDMRNNKPREYFYPSNFAPLWTQCYDTVRSTMNWLIYCIMSMNLDVSHAPWNASTSPMNCYISKALCHYHLHYSSTWVLASSRILHNPCLSLPSVLQFLTLTFIISLFTTSIHLPLGIPTSSSF